MIVQLVHDATGSRRSRSTGADRSTNALSRSPTGSAQSSTSIRGFLRGLIHSDGCRVINRFTTTLPSGRVAEYAYPRYFFSNLSADIRALFCEYCERLGIRWTQSNHRNISVAQRRSVALLDEFIGSKS